MFVSHGNRKYLSRNERVAFFKSVIKCRDPVERAFCLTLYFTGCRISEALELTVASVDVEEQCLVFRTLKQRGKTEYRSIPVPKAFLKLLKPLIVGKAPTDRIFDFCRTSGWNKVKKHMKAVGIEGKRACPKGLRHTYAVFYLMKKTPITFVRKWLGHKNLENTAIYLEIMDEEERIEARKAWPRFLLSEIIFFFLKRL